MMFASLPEGAGVRHALQLNREAGELLARHHEAVMRGPSPLTPAERELIATFVSGLNGCRYCYETHCATALCYGADRGTIEALVADPAHEAAPPRLRPLLAYARKLTLDHGSIVAEDAEAVFAAGWDERALHDTILVAAMFNFMNRFVHGHGITGDDGLWAERGRYLYDNGYARVIDPPELEARPEPVPA